MIALTAQLSEDKRNSHQAVDKDVLSWAEATQTQFHFAHKLLSPLQTNEVVSNNKCFASNSLCICEKSVHEQIRETVHVDHPDLQRLYLAPGGPPSELPNKQQELLSYTNLQTPASTASHLTEFNC